MTADLVLPRRRVIELWSWLPAFRAVAETEHVQKAALVHHVTPSSLSRAIRLLEERVGRVLFDRVGRNLRLNADGEAMLAAVRDAMRRVDDAVGLVTGTALSGELQVACEGDHPLGLAWRAAARLLARHPAVTTRIAKLETRRDLAGRLFRGELDAALVTSAPSHARLAVERLGDVTYGIYCGVGHPLHSRRHASLAAIAEYPFVAPATDDEGPGDQWPSERRRRVVLRLPALAAAIAACEGGELLAVIPDGAATARLRRLPSDAIAPSPLFAVYRRSPAGSTATSKADAFVAELRDMDFTAPRDPRLRRATRRRPAKR
jgi:DNA-binding transcriptional LysR family regulator